MQNNLFICLQIVDGASTGQLLRPARQVLGSTVNSPEVRAVKERGFAQPMGFGQRPALVVIDFINGFTDPASPLGADAGVAIAQTNRLLSSAQAHSLPVYFSRIRYDDPGCADVACG